MLRHKNTQPSSNMLIALQNIPPFNNQASTGYLEKAKVELELGQLGKVGVGVSVGKGLGDRRRS